VVLLELLLRKQPVFTTESGTKQNLCNYFLSEITTRPTTGIIAAEVLEEATEDEIEKVASLAEMCLRLRGEERPTMKQVVITLQLLLAERMNSSHVDTGNEQYIQPMVTRRALASHRQSFSVKSNNGANVAPQRSYNYSSLQREFLYHQLVYHVRCIIRIYYRLLLKWLVLLIRIKCYVHRYMTTGRTST